MRGTTEAANRSTPSSGEVRLVRPSPRIAVALVCMPFYSATRPALQLGLLQAHAERHGFSTDTFHLNLDFAAELTNDVFETIGQNTTEMFGEWLFSVAAFGRDAVSPDACLFDRCPDAVAALTLRIGKDKAFLSRVRHEVAPRFIERCINTIDWSRYRVIGFTSTFQQNVASLAMARRLKERHPEIAIVFGGANFEDEMGPAYMRAFPFIDHAVTGEGDVAFPELLTRISREETCDDCPGVISRRGTQILVGAPSPLVEMDSLPIARYDEYFVRVQELGLGAGTFPEVMPVESARGCWWGQKHHCTFCGLNGTRMTFRAKSPDRVLTELGALARRHRCTHFFAVDDILDPQYVRSLFPAIVDRRLDYTFFYAVKASLTRAQLRTMRLGGVREMQPGIESLSTHVLRLMRKGTTMLQNVRLLKWARYYDMSVVWNILRGFPGETLDDYQGQLEVARLISHLEPPTGCHLVRLDRFSPYFNDRDSFPIHNVTPLASYSHTYPSHVPLDQAAYFFEYDMADTVSGDVIDDTEAWVSEWQRRWEGDTRDSLVFRHVNGGILIDDHRAHLPIGTYRFEGLLATIYERCVETMRTPADVSAHLAEGGHEVSEQEVRWALAEFCQRGLMVAELDSFLALALPANPTW